MSLDEIAEKHPDAKEPLFKGRNYMKNECFYPGHFYSAIFDLEEVKKMEDKIWKKSAEVNLSGIELHVEEQLALTRSLAAYYEEMPHTKESSHLRYTFDNNIYPYCDGIVLFSMIRHFRPKRIIEVGSGYSSALMLDTKELFHPDLELIFIEPYPERLNSLLRENDSENCRVVVSKVQELDPSYFSVLEKGDFLFIDSSHVVKTGSDLNYLLFEIIPTLKPGVFIHFHDIFYPFEYPKNWVYQKRNWNENYFVRAFLMHNEAYKIRLFTHFLYALHKEAFVEMPLCYEKGKGGSLWLEKLT